MKQELIEQLDGYSDIVKEIEFSRKYGSDFTMEKGTVQHYINRLHPVKLKLVVNDIIEESPSTKTFRLVAEDGYLPPFLAGQYISLILEVDNIKTSRPYSISSSPNETAWYDLTVQRVEGGLVSNHLLDTIKIGDKLESSGPNGQFYFNPVVHSNTSVCIAGGSGVTPFMSMIRDTAGHGAKREIILFYGGKTIGDMAFYSELTEISSKHDNIKFVPVVENPSDEYKGKTGFITADLMKEVLDTPEGKNYYICGPQAMYDFCLPEIKKLEIPNRKIRNEMYGTPVNIWEYPGWPSTVKKDDSFSIIVNKSKTIKATASDSLLVTLERNGLIIPSTCRSGECSMCRIKILEGNVYQPEGTLVRKSDKQFGYVHSCASYPLGDLEILL